MTQLESLRDLISPRTGIIKSLALRVKSVDEPSLPHIYDAWLSHFDFRKASPTERGSCGKGMTEEAAMLGAIGEAVERYCSAQANPVSLRRATLEAAGENAVAPPEFVLYSEAQYDRLNLGFWRWKPPDEILWESMTELGSGAVARIPAVFVYLHQVGDQPQDFLCTPTSSGFAAGPNLETAIRGAILEIFERDAFMLMWLTRAPASEIETQGLGGIVGDILSTYQRWGAEIRIFALPTDMPATPVMAVALDRTGSGPAAIVALGCEMSPLEAICKALFEICQMHEPLCQRHRGSNAARFNNYQDVKTLEDHAAYFFREDHLSEFDFLLKDSRKIRLTDVANHSGGSVEADLRTLEQSLRKLGNRVFFRDLTTPELVHYPIRVARALVTHLQPISFGYGMERLGGKRLSERGVPEASLNSCPHPLA